MTPTVLITGSVAFFGSDLGKHVITNGLELLCTKQLKKDFVIS